MLDVKQIIAEAMLSEAKTISGVEYNPATAGLYAKPKEGDYASEYFWRDILWYPLIKDSEFHEVMAWYSDFCWSDPSTKQLPTNYSGNGMKRSIMHNGKRTNILYVSNLMHVYVGGARVSKEKVRVGDIHVVSTGKPIPIDFNFRTNKCEISTSETSSNFGFTKDAVDVKLDKLDADKLSAIVDGVGRKNISIEGKAINLSPSERIYWNVQLSKKKLHLLSSSMDDFSLFYDVSKKKFNCKNNTRG